MQIFLNSSSILGSLWHGLINPSPLPQAQGGFQSRIFPAALVKNTRLEKARLSPLPSESGCSSSLAVPQLLWLSYSYPMVMQATDFHFSPFSLLSSSNFYFTLISTFLKTPLNWLSLLQDTENSSGKPYESAIRPGLKARVFSP